MANGSSGAWTAAIVIAAAIALGFYYGYWKDGGGTEYGDLRYLPAA